MQPPSKGVVLNMQPYSDSKEEDGGSKPRGGVLGPQILLVKDYVLWSLFNFAFWNCCCLGFAALVFSVKSRDRKVVGDVEGASNYGKKAKCLNIIAVIVSVLFLAIIIALVATGKLAFYHTEMHDLQHQNPSFDWNQYSGK